ncbi:MAG: ankyrin repeat domain-containing protein [Bacteroidales bacterium]|nr:ankyrin repeat domain-containing protein [Bacteroidales bacterium]
MKTLTTVMLATMLLFMAACSSNQGSSDGEKKQSDTSQVTSEPPDMDIHTATFMGNLDAIHQHIAAGSDLNLKEPSVGSSPLISASIFGKTEVARALIEAGADVNLQNNEGSTALHSAAFLCRTEIVKMLLENGANKNLRTNVGSTALESVAGPFEDVRFIYDIFSRDLGPLGLKLDYEQIEETRPVIAEMLR